MNVNNATQARTRRLAEVARITARRPQLYGEAEAVMDRTIDMLCTLDTMRLDTLNGCNDDDLAALLEDVRKVDDALRKMSWTIVAVRNDLNDAIAAKIA